jgi:hypothetical protein
MSFDKMIRRVADVVQAINVQVLRGNPIYEPTGSGFQRLKVQPFPMMPGNSPVADTRPIYVVQGNNVFEFTHEEEEEANAFADELNAALSEFSKSFRRKATPRISEILSESSAKKQKRS